MRLWKSVKTLLGDAESPQTVTKQSIHSLSELPKVNLEPASANNYPMRDTPIEAKDVDFVLSTQAELIRNIAFAMPLSKEEFNELILPMIRSFAAYVHLLPASNNHHHKGRGGLFRHTLEVALMAVNMARGHMFDKSQFPSTIYFNKSRWFIVVCTAALLHDIGKVITGLTVTANDGAITWHPLTQSLAKWLKDNNVSHYYVVWRSENPNYERHESISSALLQQIVPRKTMECIEDANSIGMVLEFLDAVNGVRRSGAIVANLIKEADQSSVSRDIQNRTTDSKINVGVDTPVASIVQDIIADLIETGRWTVNDWNPKTNVIPPLWVTDEGTYLYWPNAHKDIVIELQRRNADGVPRDALILAEKLCEGKICSFPNPEVSVECFWQMLPMKTVRPKIETITDPDTGEIKTEYKNDNGDPFHYEFLQCLRLTDRKRYFEHVATPAEVKAVVINVPVPKEKADLWRNTTKMQPPQTIFESNEISKDLMEEADRRSLKLQQQSVNYDVYGNPLIPMPTIKDEDWAYIDETLPIQEVEIAPFSLPATVIDMENDSEIIALKQKDGTVEPITRLDEEDSSEEEKQEHVENSMLGEEDQPSLDEDESPEDYDNIDEGTLGITDEVDINEEDYDVEDELDEENEKEEENSVQASEEVRTIGHISLGSLMTEPGELLINNDTGIAPTTTSSHMIDLSGFSMDTKEESVQMENKDLDDKITKHEDCDETPVEETMTPCFEDTLPVEIELEEAEVSQGDKKTNMKILAREDVTKKDKGLYMPPIRFVGKQPRETVKQNIVPEADSSALEKDKEEERKDQSPSIPVKEKRKETSHKHKMSRTEILQLSGRICLELKSDITTNESCFIDETFHEGDIRATATTKIRAFCERKGYDYNSFVEAVKTLDIKLNFDEKLQRFWINKQAL